MLQNCEIKIVPVYLLFLCWFMSGSFLWLCLLCHICFCKFAKDFVSMIFSFSCRNKNWMFCTKPTNQRWPFSTVLNFIIINSIFIPFCLQMYRGGVAWAEEHRCMLGNAVSEDRTVTDVSLGLFFWRNEENERLQCFCENEEFVVVDVNVVFLFLCHNAFWVM